jgi:putative toxin-antitoxin system antitoxin component (TIGR02293 family)
MPRTAPVRRREENTLERLTQRFTHDQIEKGVAASVVGEIADADILSRGEIARLIPPRTLARRIAARERLKTEEADALGRLLRVTAKAEHIFGSRDCVHKWLRLPVPSLKNRIPIELARTDAGAREVEDALIQFAHGVYI